MPGCRLPTSACSPRAAAPPRVAARKACDGDSFMPWQASAMAICMLSQKHVPGLKSVARATVAPACSSARAGAYGAPRLKLVPGSITATTPARVSA